MKQIAHLQEYQKVLMDNLLLPTWDLVAVMEETTMEIVMNKFLKLVKHLNGVIGVPVARNVEQDTKGELDCTSCLLYPTDHVMSDCMTRMIAMDQTHLVTPMDSSKILVRIYKTNQCHMFESYN